MMKKIKVLIDGKNLRHQLAPVLCENDKIQDKNAYFPFDLRAFHSDALNQAEIEATYYTTRIKQPQQKTPLKLQKRIEAIGSANRRWIADLTNRGPTVIKAGYLRVRESNACIRRGKKTPALQQKGSFAMSSMVLVSPDSDLAPAMEAAKRSGVHIHYLCYSARLNRSVASQAHKTITFDDALVFKHFKGIS